MFSAAVEPALHALGRLHKDPWTAQLGRFRIDISAIETT